MRARIAGLSRRRLAAGGALVAVCMGLVAVIALGGDDEATGAATASTATTEIRRQDLVENETVSGTLGYGDSRQVTNRLSGTVTWLPKEGTVIKPDGTLFRVDGSQVILLNGNVPAYRALSSGVSDGADVAQLERNLRKLGYDDGKDIELDSSWDSGTTAAVQRWQEAHDFDETGSIELGRVVFQPGSRRVGEIDSSLGGDAASGGGAADPQSGTSGASYTSGQATMVFASQTTTQPEQQTTAPETETEAERKERERKERERKERERKRRAREKRQQEKKQQEQQQKQQQERQQKQQEQQQQTRSAPQGGGGAVGAAPSAAGGGTGGGAGGDTGGADTGGADTAAQSVSSAVMTTTSTKPVVTVELDTGKVELAKTGATVGVELPSGEGVSGKVTDVSSVAEPGDAAEGEEPDPNDATIPVTIELSKSIDALDQAPVSVDLESERRKDVLAVPVTALLAQAGGAFAVEVRDGDERRLVPVKPGLYAGGFVEIEGQGLEAGLKVTDARV